MAHKDIANPHGFDNIDLDILTLLKNNPEGLRVNIILKSLNLKKRSLYNHLSKLKEAELINNIYPVWQFATNQNEYLNLAKSITNKSIQSHKFSFILKLVKKPPYWNKHENRLITLRNLDKDANNTKWGNSRYTKLKLNQFLVHFFPDTILFINQKKYYSHDPYLALQKALEDTLACLEHIESNLKFKFFMEDLPQFKIRSNHYVKLKDEIANRYKNKNMPLKIEIDGKVRAWVDLSEPFGLETGDKDYGVEDMDRYKTFVTDIIKNNPPTSSQLYNIAIEQMKLSMMQNESMLKTNELMNKYDKTMEKVIEVQIGFKDNIITHMNVLNDMKEALHEIKGYYHKEKIEKSLFKSMEKNYKKKINGVQTKLWN